MTKNTSSTARSTDPLDVYFTVDVEVWCDGWEDIDAKFAQAFRRSIFGPTLSGDYGLPFQLKLLRDHGLTGVFFVEPLFSARFGLQPLAEIVGLVSEGGSQTELHLHTEWVDEARSPLLPGPVSKRQFLRQFSLTEQTALIGQGRDLLRQAGAPEVNAFRAGNFGLNRDTFAALLAAGISIDSSYNASMSGAGGLLPDPPMLDSAMVDGVLEIPITVFGTVGRKLRHVQLGACSSSELEGLLWNAFDSGRRSFVILSHNFELMNRAMSRRDDVVVKRMRKLCAFLDKHRDRFRVRGFSGAHPPPGAEAPHPLISPLWKAAARTAEQLYRSRYA